MGKTSFDLDQADLFPPGTKVGVHPAFTDHFTPPGGDPQTTATVNKDGVAHFTGLEADVTYFAAAEVEVKSPAPGNVVGDVTRKEWHHAKFTPLSKASQAHPDLRTTQPETIARRIAEGEASTAARRAAEKKDPLAASPAPGRAVQPNRVRGSRSSNPREQADLEARRVHQRDVKGPQRSDTLHGEAVPTDKSPAPAPKQEDVPKRTKQRSDTKTGEAEPAPKKSSKTTKQPSRAKQSSATKRGEATQKSRRTQKPRSRAKR